MRKIKTPINISEIMLDNILLAMEEEFFSRDKSAKIVGGLKRLESLIASGEIRADKPTLSQNGKWFCNAADVLRHCRNLRPKTRKDEQ